MNAKPVVGQVLVERFMNNELAYLLLKQEHKAWLCFILFARGQPSDYYHPGDVVPIELGWVETYGRRWWG